MAGRRFGGRTLARSQALQLMFQAEATGRTVADTLAGDYVLDEDRSILCRPVGHRATPCCTSSTRSSG